MNQRARQAADQRTIQTGHPTPLSKAGARSLPVPRMEIAILVILVLVTLIAHGINIRHSPTMGRLNDEGIYTQQAWSVLKMGQLSPYTYWYDHAPAGWIFLAGWMGITGPFAFGSAIDTSRVLILLLSTASVVLLYFLSRKFELSPALAGLGALMFSLSPLALSFGRMVLLDNIMVFWLLVSLNLLVVKDFSMRKVFLSGLTFGVAVLTKEPAVLLLPVLIYIAYRLGRASHEPLTLAAWLAPVVFVVALYPMAALLRGELISIPIANSPFDSRSGVYLIDTLRWQTARGGEGLGFIQNAGQNWIPADPILFLFGILAMLANLVIGFRSRQYLSAGLLGLLPLIYIARGGVVFDFYILFVLPFLCLNLVLLVGWLLERFDQKRFTLPVVGGMIALFVLTNFLTGQIGKAYSATPDRPYRQALGWISSNTDPYSVIVIPDNYWVDMHEPRRNSPAYPNAHSYWKVGTDPAVRDQLLGGDYHNINYVVLFPGMREQIFNGGHTLTIEALNNAVQVQRFEEAGSFVEIWHVNDSIVPEGPLEVPDAGSGAESGRSPAYRALLEDSYLYMKNTFSQEGRYHSRDGSVTSESQAYAMLRAVWMDDRDEFDRTWQWTRENLINSNGLLSWQWKDGAVTDPSSNAGADTQAALALILGGRRWGDPALVEGGTAMIQSIREHEVIVIAGRPYMAAGDWAVNTDPLAANPSYFSPFAYRVFEEVDPDGGWTEILASGYQLARDSANISFAGEAAAGLPPDWIGIRREDGQLVKLELAGNEDTTRYGYIAPRLFWQVALDYNLTQDSRAQEILNQAGFIGEQVRQRGFPGSVYAHDGTMITGESTPVANAGALSVLVVRDPQAAERFFRDQYVDRAQHPQSEQAAWGDPSDLSNQEWAWFAVGMYNNNLLLYQK